MKESYLDYMRREQMRKAINSISRLGAGKKKVYYTDEGSFLGNGWDYSERLADAVFASGIPFLSDLIIEDRHDKVIVQRKRK